MLPLSNKPPQPEGDAPFLTASHHASRFFTILISHRPLCSFRCLCPLQNFENAGEFLDFLISWNSITGSDTPSALGLVHSVYCCHFSPFCTFLIQNSHSLLRFSCSICHGKAMMKDSDIAKNRAGPRRFPNLPMWSQSISLIQTQVATHPLLIFPHSSSALCITFMFPDSDEKLASGTWLHCTQVLHIVCVCDTGEILFAGIQCEQVHWEVHSLGSYVVT